MIRIRPATFGELNVISESDRHVPREHMEKLISDGFIAAAFYEEQFAGLLRYGLFWDEVPFMNMLWVKEEYRGKGVGTALVREW